MSTSYFVAVGQSTTMQGLPCPDHTCGHKHRRQAAAEKCRDKLLGCSRDGKSWSAMWHGCYILCNKSRV